MYKVLNVQYIEKLVLICHVMRYTRKFYVKERQAEDNIRKRYNKRKDINQPPISRNIVLRCNSKFSLCAQGK
jgi:methionyl-tRNA synthetase